MAHHRTSPFAPSVDGRQDLPSRIFEFWEDDVGWRAAVERPLPAALAMRAGADGCVNGCGLHGHRHRIDWTPPIPVANLKAFRGAASCACFA